MDKAFTQKDFEEVSKRIYIKLLNKMFYLNQPIVQSCKTNILVTRSREDFKLCKDLECESCNKFKEHIDKYKLNG